MFEKVAAEAGAAAPTKENEIKLNMVGSRVKAFEEPSRPRAESANAETLGLPSLADHPFAAHMSTPHSPKSPHSPGHLHHSLKAPFTTYVSKSERSPRASPEAGPPYNTYIPPPVSRAAIAAEFVDPSNPVAPSTPTAKLPQLLGFPFTTFIPTSPPPKHTEKGSDGHEAAKPAVNDPSLPTIENAANNKLPQLLGFPFVGYIASPNAKTKPSPKVEKKVEHSEEQLPQILQHPFNGYIPSAPKRKVSHKGGNNPMLGGGPQLLGHPFTTFIASPKAAAAMAAEAAKHKAELAEAPLPELLGHPFVGFTPTRSSPRASPAPAEAESPKASPKASPSHETKRSTPPATSPSVQEPQTKKANPAATPEKAAVPAHVKSPAKAAVAEHVNGVAKDEPAAPVSGHVHTADIPETASVHEPKGDVDMEPPKTESVPQPASPIKAASPAPAVDPDTESAQVKDELIQELKKLHAEGQMDHSTVLDKPLFPKPPLFTE